MCSFLDIGAPSSTLWDAHTSLTLVVERLWRDVSEECTHHRGASPLAARGWAATSGPKRVVQCEARLVQLGASGRGVRSMGRLMYRVAGSIL